MRARTKGVLGRDWAETGTLTSPRPQTMGSGTTIPRAPAREDGVTGMPPSEYIP